MTIEEVKFCINGDGLIECRDVCQRMEAVQFLVDIGYELHPAAKSGWMKIPTIQTSCIQDSISATIRSPATVETTARKQFHSGISKC